MAFHFEKPAGFEFRARQAMDVTLLDLPESDAEGNTRTFSVASRNGVRGSLGWLRIRRHRTSHKPTSGQE